VNTALPTDVLDFLDGSIRVAVLEVKQQGVIEQNTILRDDTNMFSE